LINSDILLRPLFGSHRRWIRSGDLEVDAIVRAKVFVSMMVFSALLRNAS